MRHLALVALALILVAAGVFAQHDHQSSSIADAKLGTVHFQNSCSASAQRTFIRGVALLHSFEFGQAVDSFNQTLKIDPGCGIAYWGVALSQWGNPFASRQVASSALGAGLEAVGRARSAGLKTEREQRYVAAVERLFADSNSRSQADRFTTYTEAMERLSNDYPGDSEASIFYALALAAGAPPADKTYAKQLKAGAILERLFAEQPDHPGLAHYIIHSYDVPPLAPKALAAARRYAEIAPDAPHALHMPSHTFTRLGLWQESIEANIASASVARRQRTTAEELHAMDYLVYAYLQTAQDRAASEVLGRLDEVLTRFRSGGVESAAPVQAGSFASAAIPARFALERRRWDEAARLAPQAGYPFTEALTHFARALGAARTGDLASARSSIATLEQLQKKLASAAEQYWAEQVGIEHRAAQAWLAFAEGRRDNALATLRQAADMEDATEKSAITPGPLVPARELLGEMLLQLDRPADAEVAFTTALKHEPNRFRAVYGAARAASLAGHGAAARLHYEQLLKICERADTPGRLELREAADYLASHPK